jgi:transcription initiation factor TFIID subunit TAF12
VEQAQQQQQQQQQGQQQQQQQQSDVTPLVDAQQSADSTPPVASFSGRPIQQQPPMAAMGARRVDPSVFAGSKAPRAKREGVVHVNSTFNNTHLVLTDRASKVEAWVSGGTVGYKNANKVGAVTSC